MPDTSALRIMCAKPLMADAVDKLLDSINDAACVVKMPPVELMLVTFMDLLRTAIMTGREMGFDVDIDAYAKALKNSMEDDE